MNHHRTRQFLAEMAEPIPPTNLQPELQPGIDEQRGVSSCKAALNLRTGSKDSPGTGLHNARHPAFYGNRLAALADEERSEGRPFPRKRSNPHGE